MRTAYLNRNANESPAGKRQSRRRSAMLAIDPLRDVREDRCADLRAKHFAASGTPSRCRRLRQGRAARHFERASSCRADAGRGIACWAARFDRLDRRGGSVLQRLRARNVAGWRWAGGGQRSRNRCEQSFERSKLWGVHALYLA